MTGLTEKADYSISVVIPAYNCAAYIERTINSVLAQSLLPDEIIVVDDGSADNTSKVVRRFGDKVILIHQDNAGASVARNTGIEAATSKWIAFLDGDDELVPEKIQLQVENLQEHPDLVWAMSNYYTCFCDPDHTLTIYDQGKSDAVLKGRNYYNDYFEAYKSGVVGNMNTMLIQKAVLIEAGLFRVGQPRMNDEDMWFRIAYRHPKIGYLKTPLAIYHRGVPGSIVKKNNHCDIVIELLHRHLALSESHGRLEAFRPVARSIAKMWIHWCWQDERAYQVRKMLRELGFLLPRSYKLALYILTIFPGLTLAMMPILRKINKVLKLPL